MDIGKRTTPFRLTIDLISTTAQLPAAVRSVTVHPPSPSASLLPHSHSHSHSPSSRRALMLFSASMSASTRRELALHKFYHVRLPTGAAGALSSNEQFTIV
ncbi:hypothetical protein AB1N83_013728 [Pleurotus pulmonarius]